jgi:putative DNA primase/helicase
MPRAELAGLMEPVARALLGAPNEAMSSRQELRFGGRGSVSVDCVKGTFFDFQLNEGGGVLDLIEQRLGLTGRDAFDWMRAERIIDRDVPARPPTGHGSSGRSDKQRTEEALRIWRECQAASGTAVEAYLRRRGITFPPPPTLRHHSGLRHRCGAVWPAMVGAVTIGTERIPVGVHRTFLAPDGVGKAPVEPNKMTTGPVPRRRHPAGTGHRYANGRGGRRDLPRRDVGDGNAGLGGALDVRTAHPPAAGRRARRDRTGRRRRSRRGRSEARGGEVEARGAAGPHRPAAARIGLQRHPCPAGRRCMTADKIVQIIAAAEDVEVEEARPPAFSDEAIALRFAERHQNDLRYVAAWGKWLSWTGTHWRFDDTLLGFDLARRICREAAAECNKPNHAKTIASAKTVAAVERLTRADRRIAATTDQWDADPWLLNTPGGVVDFRTGRARPAIPGDYQTKITAVAPGGECPIFRAFLRQIAGEDEGLELFVQRMLGYALTGSTREHALFFLYGTGANGKSVLTSTVAGVLGDYHRTSAIETFTATNQDRHPTDLAGLRGARLVTATETEEGRRWAESKIKVLTGGDPISARFMRQDFFEYVPQFKLIIAGNHKPGLRSVNEAIRRRFHLVPFTVTIPPEERDRELSEKLKAEWPGILTWMIEGCRSWQDQGLDPPEAVTEATEAYLEAEDAMGAWIEECCE